MVSQVTRLFFSRLLLGGQAPRDVYGLHQLLWRAFEKGPRPFLFRADRVRVESRAIVKVLVQSSREASWSALEDAVVEAEQVQRQVHAADGQEFRFYLRANASRRTVGSRVEEAAAINETNGRTGPRIGLVREEDQRAWLDRKATKAGFRILGVRLRNVRPWRWQRGSTTARHDGVDFEGALRVEEPESFLRALETGIGSAKAFGFGLLSLARLQD